MKSTLKLLLIVAITLPVVALGQAQRPSVFANPKNLKVLPKDISSQELNVTMRSFAMGLGVRCETCHVGEAGQPLTTFDFESDEKSMKRKARVMMRMVAAINTDHVATLGDIEAGEPVEVRCVTCHRGRPKPKMIEDVLDEQLANGGADSAINTYVKLREEFYGSHSYDFSEYSLPMYAQAIAGSDNIDAALALAKLNTEHFPDSSYSYFVLAELYAATGEKAAAIEAYERTAELEPRNRPVIEAKIKALTAGSD